ncbi:Rha family transcriptional regulator [Microbacterium enclense]|uniref:Rha family transcriptional regulator n=1 Tax=Microbacterium enclense TaxID=993073 RepID=UPI003436F672
MSVVDIIERGGDLLVSSETIAEGTENQHKNVLQLIRTYRDDLEEFGRVESQTRPFDTAGGTQYREVFLLNEPQATLILTYMRNMDRIREFKKALVRAFFDMARRLTAVAVPQTLAEALELAAAEARQIEALEAKIAADAPKVEYIDTFVADEDLRILRNVAKSLGLKEDDLRNALVAHKWVYREETTRYSQKEQQKVPYVRYSAYADKRDYFRPVPNHDAPRFKGEVMHTLKVTPAGATAIARAARSWGLAGEVAA